MRLNAPKKKVFWIGIIIAAVAVVAFIVSFFVATSIISPIAFVLLLIAYVLLVMGNVLKGF